MRIRHYLKYSDYWGIENTYETDPETNLRTPIPNGKFGPVEINSLGFRSPEIEVPKPPGVLRLAFLGASTTYGAELSSNDMTWPNLAVERLRTTRPDLEIDFVNASVPGYSVVASLKNLRHRVAPLEPDIIVIYHATNDLSGNSFGLALRQGIVEERAGSEMSWPSRYSLLWYLVEKNLMVMTAQARSHDRNAMLEFEVEELARPFRDDLTELVRASARVADKVVLITFSTQLREEQTAEDRRKASVTSLFYMPYMSIEGLLEGFASYNDVIREVASAEQVELIEAADVVPGDARHFNDSVHFTDAGSILMAAAVADGLMPVIESVARE